MDTSNSSAIPTSQSKSISLKPVNQHSMHTHTCGELRAENIGEVVTLTGWVWRRRDFGGLVFVDLRDREDLTQVLFDPDVAPEAFKTAEGIRPEWPVCITGTVQHRSEGQTNESLATGEVEILASEIEVLNTAQTPPFQIENHIDVNEDLRLKYRYVDLRRPRMARNLRLRSDFTFALREAFHKRDFTEVETPALFKSTPEGARDFLVPSRMQGGSFYALPQSPQLLKQLLMIGGVERYYQVAKCFRDEDLRADRQPEFTQVDTEMSFVTQDDVMSELEDILSDAFGKMGIQMQMPLRRMQYWQYVKAINARGAGSWPRSQIDKLGEVAAGFGAKGLTWIAYREDGSVGGPIAKFFSADELDALRTEMEAQPGDLILFAVGARLETDEILGGMRLHMARVLEVPREGHDFLWVVNFPLFHWDEETQSYASEHMPFTQPNEDQIDLLDTDPLSIGSHTYDFVMDGFEAGGGGMRIHNADLQLRILEKLGFTKERAEAQFGFLMEALTYGAPPMGGFALGLDRVCMLLAGADSIRDVMAFPKTTSGSDLMSAAPSPVTDDQLKEVSLRTL